MSDDLPRLKPDAARGALTRARCHARLEAQRRKIEADARRPDPAIVTAERCALVGACAAYLFSMAGNLLRTFEFR